MVAAVRKLTVERLRKRVEAKIEPRLVPRRRIGMEDSLMGRVVDERQRRSQQRLRRSLVLSLDSSSQPPHLVPELRQVRAIRERALVGLLDTLQSGFVTCHIHSFWTECKLSI